VKSKRPWKKYAKIERIEHNNGDVKFVATVRGWVETGSSLDKDIEKGRFESLTEAEGCLNAWWSDWWPKQIKSSRPA